jgi:electron transfer flavoprotein beta subunit
MNIFVCIKQVPDSTSVDIDPVTMTLIRAGIDSKINPYDLFALETSIKLKEKTGAEITTISMGPPQAQEAIKESFTLGVDHGLLLSDKRFAGADVLATAYTLAQGILAKGIPDLIICGKQTTDGDTGQVGPEIAEFLDIPHVANVIQILEVHNDYLKLKVNMPQSVETIKIPFPCLITVEKNIFQPRLPSFKLKLATRDRLVEMLTLDDLPDQNLDHYGLDGSPTQVKAVFPPEENSDHEVWSGSGEELSKRLFEKLKEQKFV